MNITIKDKSTYLKGLLLLIAKDSKIDAEEEKLVLKIGKLLGFEKKFCQTAINEILINEFIDDTPPEFSNKNFAQCFIIDGIKLAFADGNFHPNEINYLRQTAIKNDFEEEWFKNNLTNFVANKVDTGLELRKFKFD